MSTVSHEVFFDDHQLTLIAGLNVVKVNPYIPPKRKLNISDIARTSKSKVNTGFYTSKQILIRVTITRNTRRLLEASIDDLLSILQGISKDLIVPQSSGLRSYTATLADAPVSNDGGSFITMDLVFECTDRYGYDLARSLALNLGNTTVGSSSANASFSGSAEKQQPLITITLAALTGGTGATITAGNPLTNQIISVQRTWSAGDVLIIDSAEKTVQVNGTDVDFTGGFPEWAPTTGTWQYTDDLTTRTFRAMITYYKRYQ